MRNSFDSMADGLHRDASLIRNSSDENAVFAQGWLADEKWLHVALVNHSCVPNCAQVVTSLATSGRDTALVQGYLAHKEQF